jgi:hypothetical protein
MQSVIETFFYHPAVWWICAFASNASIAARHGGGSVGDPLRALTRFEELRLDAQTLAANGGSLLAHSRVWCCTRGVGQLVFALGSRGRADRGARGHAVAFAPSAFASRRTTPKPATPNLSGGDRKIKEDKKTKKEKECDKPNSTVDVEAEPDGMSDESTIRKRMTAR